MRFKPGNRTDLPDFAVKAEGVPDSRFHHYTEAMFHLAGLSLSGIRKVRITHREPRALAGKFDCEIGTFERTEDGGGSWAGYDAKIANYSHRRVSAKVMSAESSERLVAELSQSSDRCCAGGCAPGEQKREIHLCAH